MKKTIQRKFTHQDDSSARPPYFPEGFPPWRQSWNDGSYLGGPENAGFNPQLT
jgi:hypothetical protein